MQPSCSVCNRQKANLLCDKCKKIYHSKYIPNHHKSHISNLQDNDTVLCHQCYKEAGSDESDENFDDIQSETDESENFNVEQILPKQAEDITTGCLAEDV